MSDIRIPQNPGIGGLDELTASEEVTVQEIDGISHAKGTILVSTGSVWSSLTVGPNDETLTADSAQATGLKWAAAAGGGDVTGPGSSTDNAIVRFDGASGKTIQDYTSGAPTISDTGDMVIGQTLTLANTGLHILDTNASHDLIIKVGSNITADKTLTLTTGDADRTITLSGNPTLADWFDQGVKSGASPTFDSANFTGIGGQFTVANVSGATFTNIQHMQDVFHSPGWVSGGGITDDGDGTVTVATGTGLIRATDSAIAEILFFDWAAEAGANVNLADNDINYIYAEYNAGSPRVIATTTVRTDVNTNVLLANIQRSGTTLHINTVTKHVVGDHASNMILRLKDTMPFAQVSGAIISASGTRNLAATAGAFWEGLTSFSTNSFDHAASGNFTYWYRKVSDSGWNAVTSQTQIHQTNYDDNSGTLGTLSNNKYGVHWVYLEVDNDVQVVYGQGDYTLKEAQDAQPPSGVPEPIEAEGFLIGKVIIKESEAAFTQIETAFDGQFVPSVATDHGSLTGLSDDDHTQYLLANATRALSSNWDVGAFTITGTQFISDITTGTAPFVVASTTEVANLKAATVGTIAGLAPDTATTQATQAAITSAANLVTVGTLSGGNATAIVDAATATAAGKVELATIDETNTGTDTGRAVTPDGISAAVKSIMLTASGGAPLTTAGCSDPTKVEAATNDINYYVLDFDTTTEEHAFWSFPMPDNWDAGVVNATFYWTNTGGAGGQTVDWGIAGGSWGNDDAIDAALGSEITTTDTYLAQGDMHISGASTDITIANAAAGEWVNIVVARKVASDNLAGDARLIMVKLEYKISAYSE